MTRTFNSFLIFGLTIVLTAVVFVAAILWQHEVSLEISGDDRAAIALTYKRTGLESAQKPDDFDGQIDLIRAIQSAAFAITPAPDAIPMYRKREPQDLLDLGTANCSDRSRFLHKALRLSGFEVRYASIFATPDGKNPILTVLTPHNKKVRSHALIEVKTAKGWMFVDTVEPWIAISEAGQPYSLEDWQNTAYKSEFEWEDQGGAEIYFILKDDFTYVFGLYSRHGKFYPPYNFIPDVNWSEIFQNF